MKAAFLSRSKQNPIIKTFLKSLYILDFWRILNKLFIQIQNIWVSNINSATLKEIYLFDFIVSGLYIKVSCI